MASAAPLMASSSLRRLMAANSSRRIFLMSLFRLATSSPLLFLLPSGFPLQPSEVAALRFVHLSNFCHGTIDFASLLSDVPVAFPSSLRSPELGHHVGAGLCSALWPARTLGVAQRRRLARSRPGGRSGLCDVPRCADIVCCGCLGGLCDQLRAVVVVWCGG